MVTCPSLSLWLSVTLVCCSGGNDASGSIAGTGGNTNFGGSSVTTGGATLTASATVGNLATGGSGASGAGGSTPVATGGTPINIWPAAYDPMGTPTPADAGHHASEPAAGATCMSCHNSTSGRSSLKLVFGGIVYQPDGVTPAAHVEIAVSDGTHNYFTYSAGNGYFWATGTDSVAWAMADIRVRNAAGEHIKPASGGRNANCLSCHSAADALKAP